MAKMKENLYTVSALYKFVELKHYREIREPLLETMLSLHIVGTLLLAEEGINGTIAGSEQSINALYQYLATIPGLDAIEHKESYHQQLPFKRTKVKLKKEIVTIGREEVSPTKIVGTYIEPEDWNQLIERDDVLLVDTRNQYEVEIGSFKNAINPRTETFREFPDYVDKHLDKTKHKHVAMFCTGGIRCEKSTALLKQQGFDNVYHLKGGILNYLEKVPEAKSLWQGECFVFDERVAVDHDLNKGQYSQCFACRYPITEEDKQSEYYQKGVSCPRCYHRMTKQQKARFSERQKQNELAKARGEAHIGDAVTETIKKRKAMKDEAKRSQQAHQS